jgi:hypothetical protein
VTAVGLIRRGLWHETTEDRIAWTTDTRRDYVRPSGDLRKRWDGSGMGADRAAAAAGTARGARALRTHDGPSMTKAKISESVIAKYGPNRTPAITNGLLARAPHCSQRPLWADKKVSFPR